MTDTLTKDELIKAAWDRWFKEDFSWEGLKKKPWKDDLTLQDYWLSDPQTGQIRTEDELRTSGELIEVEGQKTYHIAHLPLDYQDATPTLKSTNRDQVEVQIQALIETRLIAATTQSEDIEQVYAVQARLEGSTPLNLDLSKTTFNYYLNAAFNECLFLGSVYFLNAELKNRTQFKYAAFFEEIKFYDCTFEGSIYFFGSTFLNFVDFRSSKFRKDASFGRVRFYGGTDFDEAIFYSDVSFKNVKFFANATFSRSQFKEIANFREATFNSYSGFQLAIFSNEANFYFANFLGKTNFDKAIFSDELQLSRTTFQNEFSFQYVIFSKAVHFNGSEWKERDDSYFVRSFKFADFKERLDLTKLKHELLPVSVFNRAIFRDGIIINDANALNEGTLIDSELKAASEPHVDRDERLTALEGGCRVLKNELAKIRDVNREQLFSTYEIKARMAKSSTSWWEKRVSGAYGFFADYGGSIGKPVIWLLATIPIFFLFYCFIDREYAALSVTYDALNMPNLQIQSKSDCDWYNSLSVSLSRVFPFGGFEFASKSFAKHIDTYFWKFLFQLMATFQSLISLILVFLAGLAVRRKFQIN